MKKQMALLILLLGLLSTAVNAASIHTSFQVTCTVVYHAKITQTLQGVEIAGKLKPQMETQTVFIPVAPTPQPQMNPQTQTLQSAPQPQQAFQSVTLETIIY
jgi:uridylate kinase